jgi:hypothetical protein
MNVLLQQCSASRARIAGDPIMMIMMIVLCDADFCARNHFLSLVRKQCEI